MQGEVHGYSGRRCVKVKKGSSLRKQGMGGFENRSRFPAEMPGVWTSDYDAQAAGGKKREGDIAVPRNSSVPAFIKAAASHPTPLCGSSFISFEGVPLMEYLHNFGTNT